MLPGIVCPILIFGFIVITQLAHDADRCPYAERSRRPLGADATVLEEGRTCLPRVEERRFTLLRGAQAQVLGTRRLRASAFGKGYHWNAMRGPGGEVKIVIHNDGYGELTFREGTAQEKGQR
jgi:hypothetical protein